MPHSRPYLLPISRAYRIGLPWHGLVRNGLLQVDSGTRQYVAASANWSSATLAVRHPNASPSLNIDNDPSESQDRQWQNYALLSDDRRMIGGDPIDGEQEPPIGSQAWLYCDANRAWVVYYELTGNSSSFTVSVYLKQIFGVFGDDRPQMGSARLLAQQTFSAKTYAGGTPPSTYSIMARSSHSLTGAVSTINIGSWGSGTGSVWPGSAIAMYSGGTFVKTLCIHNVVKVTLSGNGSMEDGDVGAGISAVIASEAEAPDLELSYIGIDEAVYKVRNYNIVAAVSHSGTITWLNWYFTQTISSEYEDLGGGYTKTITTTTQVGYTEFGGVQVDHAASMIIEEDPFINYGNPYLVSGEINGVAMSDSGWPYTDVVIFASAYSVLVSASLECLAIGFYGSANNAVSYILKAAGKEGHSEDLDPSFDPADTDFTYDSARGLITVGGVGERVVYV